MSRPPRIEKEKLIKMIAQSLKKGVSVTAIARNLDFSRQYITYLINKEPKLKHAKQQYLTFVRNIFES